MSMPNKPYNEYSWIIGSPSIGKGCWIGAFTLIDGSGGLVIGDGCEISCGAQILTHSSEKRCVTERKHPTVDRKPTTIGNNVFVGSNAVVLMGCVIGNNVTIGAGAVVLEGTVIPNDHIAVGVPARIIPRKDM